MSEPKADAKLYETARAVIASHRGTDGSTASSGTTCTGAEAEATPKPTPSGHASTVTGPGTLAHNSRLSAEERQELNRLRTIRKRGMMLSMGECDWLLDLYWRLKL